MKTEPIIIAGAGPIGLACAISAKRRGVNPLVVDAGAVCNSILRYPAGMTFFTTPERLEIGGHPLVCAGQKPAREEALKYYRGVVRAEGIRVRTYTQLAGASHDESGVLCRVETRLGPEELLCERLVLASGYFDHPNLLGVPGEELPHVSHYFDEAHKSFGLDVAVIGGRNSAVEAALDLFRTGARVTIVYRGAALPPSVKYWLKPDIENRIKAGEIKAHFGSRVVRMDERSVHVESAAGEAGSIPAERVYALTGFHPDFDLFRRIGIEIEAESGRPRLDPETLETNVPGVHMAGSITRGREISNIFIENGRFDGERIFGDTESRAKASKLYGAIQRHYAE